MLTIRVHNEDEVSVTSKDNYLVGKEIIVSSRQNSYISTVTLDERAADEIAAVVEVLRFKRDCGILREQLINALSPLWELLHDSADNAEGFAELAIGGRKLFSDLNRILDRA
jgi:hypothetical protein